MDNIKILFVEDLGTDVELSKREIRKQGIEFTAKVVETENDFRKALADFEPDVIISDYAMPTFDGMSALKITRASPIYIPFILLTGTMNEETAVACMKAGADDYVIKDNIKRLPFAILDIIEKIAFLREKDLAEKQLRESEEKYRRLTENAQDLIYRYEFAPKPGFTYVSPSATEITGYSPGEHYADPDLGYKMVHPEDKHLLEALSKSEDLIRKPISLRWIKKDGSIIWTEQRNVPIYDTEGALIALECIARDITVRKKAEQALQASLEEKNQLIRELFHRTKNNMQVIISMLMLQSGFTEDKQVKDIFQDTISRLQAMSLVHEKLYQSQHLSRINLDEYLHDLAQLLARTYHVTSNKIDLTFDLETISTLIDIATPCGLVVNELISNAFKHAFPAGQDGEIHIALHRANDQKLITLVVSDNGVGMPRNFDYRRSKTFGLPTIVAIVEHQLQGKIVFEGEDGVTCRIQFHDSQYKERV